MPKSNFSLIKSSSLNRLIQSLSKIQSNVAAKDTEGHYVACNQIVADFVGLSSPSEVIGGTDLDFPWSGRHAIYRGHDKVIAETKQPYFFIEPALNIDNKLINLLCIKSPVIFSNGLVSGTVGIGISLNQQSFNEILYQFISNSEKLNLKLDSSIMIRVITQTMKYNDACEQWKSKSHLFDYGEVKFTLREAQCMHYFLNNYSAKKTSEKIHISQKTVESHLAKIKSKLKCRDTTEITNKAIDLGFIDLMFMRF